MLLPITPQVVHFIKIGGDFQMPITLNVRDHLSRTISPLSPDYRTSDSRIPSERSRSNAEKLVITG